MTARAGAGPPLAVDAAELAYRYSARGTGVADIGLGVREGEIVGLLGPNGGGKSTLLRLLATALRPQRGTLRLLGHSAVPPARSLRRALGYAAESPVHVDALSGLQNAVFFARAAGLPHAAARHAVHALFERLDLAADARRAVREYSHGMRRKLLLAQALAHDPRVILLDEPTLGLDASSRAALRDLLRERAVGGAGIALATHELDLAAELCDRVVFLLDGHIALEGEPAALLRAIGAGTLIRIALREPLAEPLRLGDAAAFRAGDDRIELHTTAGAAGLPELCATLLRSNVRIHTIELHEPDLRAVFMNVTGRTWTDAP
jgi:ABC-2 type transport system ATP-binding protein